MIITSLTVCTKETWLMKLPRIVWHRVWLIIENNSINFIKTEYIQLLTVCIVLVATTSCGSRYEKTSSLLSSGLSSCWPSILFTSNIGSTCDGGWEGTWAGGAWTERDVWAKRGGGSYINQNKSLPNSDNNIPKTWQVH